MKKTPLVFSFVREQKSFMILLVGLLSFLSILALGLVISLGTAIHRWNAQWSLMATAQVIPSATASASQAAVMQIISASDSGVESYTIISVDEATQMLRPWLGGSDALTQYIPWMAEIRFTDATAVGATAELIGAIDGARFIRHNDTMRGTTAIGFRVIGMAALVLLLVLGAVVLCISYITRNITLIHKRELEILNQIGARDSFVAKQLMIIIGRIAAVAVAAGFVFAVPALFAISAIASGAKTGMFTQMSIPWFGWLILLFLAIDIIALSIWTANRTVIKILNK